MKSFTFGSRQGPRRVGPVFKTTCKECSSHSTCNGNHTCTIGKVAKSRTLSGKALVIWFGWIPLCLNKNFVFITQRAWKQCQIFNKHALFSEKLLYLRHDQSTQKT